MRIYDHAMKIKFDDNLLPFFMELPSNDQLEPLLDTDTEESYLGAAMYSQPADSSTGTMSNQREKKLLSRINK
jgi:hypothetical protein